MNILLHFRRSPCSAARIGGAKTSIRLMAEKLAQRIGAVDGLQYPNPLRRLLIDGVGGIGRRMSGL